MEHYAEFDIATGRIVRRGGCQSQHIPIPRQSNAIALVRADPSYNTIICDEISDERIAVNPTLARKHFDRPKPIKLQEGKKQAIITNEQWQDVLNKLDKIGEKE